jgi:hypothetical protein
MTTITLRALLEVLLEMQGTFVLCNAHGSLEFKGQDLYLSPYQEWLTVYHATPQNPESQSHLHLKWHTFQRAVVTHTAGRTPYLAFYGTAEVGDEAPLLWYFPSFYNWANGKTEIPENIAQYETFVTTYGTALQLVEPAAIEE